MSDFLCAYLNAATFFNDDIDPQADIADEAFELIKAECLVFERQALVPLFHACAGRYDVERAGHDFYLSRNGHGAGFWCRDEIEPKWRDALQNVAEWFGPSDLYTGDDGKLYV